MTLKTIILSLFTCFGVSIAHAQSIRPANDRLDAIVSYPLIIPIVTDKESALRKPVITKLDDGRIMKSEPFWIGVSPQKITNQHWTRPSGIWTASDYQSITKIQPELRPLGTWFIRINLPIDAVGQGLWFEDQRYDLNWLPDPERTILEARDQQTKQAFNTFWNLRLNHTALHDTAVQYAIDQYTQSPFEHWRAELLVNGLDPHPSHNQDAAPTNDTIESLELELAMQTPGSDLLAHIARQNKAKWQIILGRIWLIDPQAAGRLKAQLMMTARFGSRTLPLWNNDSNALDRLAQDLLSPFIDDQTRVLRANAWLESLPRALAWVTDDQGTIEDQTNNFIPTITAISLPQTPGTSLFRIDSPSNPQLDPELTTLPPYIAMGLWASVNPIPISPTNPNLESTRLLIRTGRWSTATQVIASLTTANPPYIRIGPLLNDWTMDALLNQRPFKDASPLPNRSAIGMLRKSTPPSRDQQTIGWQLYFELASPNPTSPLEKLNIWVGPYNAPIATWTITPQGQVTLDAGSNLNIGIPAVQTVVFNDRWVVTIDLPPAAIDHDLILQLGIERTDAIGNHTAWPRRMIPDQTEPGRLAIKLNQYDGFKN